MSSKLTLKISGQQTHFFTANINFSLEQLAHTFEATIVYQKITAPLPVEWLLNGQPIFDGQIDSSSESSTDSGSVLKIIGRSQTANFIDSRIKTDAVYNQSFDALLAGLFAAYGLTVQNNVKTEIQPITEFQLNAESPLNGISQLAKHRNLMLIERVGKVLIERPGQFQITGLALEEGLNLESIDINRNWAQQYAHYEIQGGWDDAQAVVTDSNVNPNRKCVIIADKLQDQQACQDRAEYEKNLAIAKSLTVSSKLPGLHPELTGAAINKVIAVRSKPRSFSENLLIKGVVLEVTESQETTKVDLFRPFKELAE